MSQKVVRQNGRAKRASTTISRAARRAAELRDAPAPPPPVTPENQAIAQIEAVRRIAESFQSELRGALARKPNEVLNRLVYQLAGVRHELSDVQESLRQSSIAMTSIVTAQQRIVALLERVR